MVPIAACVYVSIDGSIYHFAGVYPLILMRIPKYSQ
jgi:hypothetical protein